MESSKQRFSVSVDEDLYDKINTFQHDHRMKSQTQAVVEILKIGIQTILKEKEYDCSTKFRNNLEFSLQVIRDNLAGDEEGMSDYYELHTLVESTYPLSLAEACIAADKVGESVSYLLGEKNDNKEEKPTPVSGNGLDGLDRLLIENLQDLTPDVKRMLLAQMQVMKESQKELSPFSAQG